MKTEYEIKKLNHEPTLYRMFTTYTYPDGVCYKMVDHVYVKVGVSWFELKIKGNMHDFLEEHSDTLFDILAFNTL